VISRTLGHSQIATTADVYAHLTPAMLERTAARMDGVLTPGALVSGPFHAQNLARPEGFEPPTY
jgi:hypothetical protein